MPTDQNSSHGRRPHFHRGRRGQDRRGTPPPQEQAGRESGREGGRDNIDVEHIMREIRSRISQRHGIELTTPQIQELAARRLEAILDPRTVKPSLLEQIRRSAATPADAAPVEPAYTFEENTLFESPRGSLRFFRRLLNPLLKLFLNLTPLIHALVTQTRLNKAGAAREAERDRRQAEWNALHYDILQRLVTEIARTSIDAQNLSMRVEALSAKLDFAERRTRSIEGSLHQARPVPRPFEAAPPATPAPPPREPRDSREQREPREPREPRESAPQDAAGATPAPGQGPGAAPEGAGEGGRRRRRRRRGRRPQGTAPDAVLGPGPTGMSADVARDQVAENADALDGDDTDEDEGMADSPQEDGSVTAPAAIATEPATPPSEVPTQHASVFEPVSAPVPEAELVSAHEPEPPSASAPEDAPSSTDENERPPRPNAFGSSEG